MVSNAQTKSNFATAAGTQAANNVNQVGPNGSVTYKQTGTYTDPTTGASLPTYTQTTELDPLSQAILTGTKQVGASLVPTAQTLAGQAATSATTPLNFDTAFSGTLNKSPDQINQQASDAIYSNATRYLDPQFQTQQRQLEDQLSRQGIPVGSEAYNNAMTNFNSTKNQAYGSARDTATAGGTQAATNLFGLAQQGQNQQIAQQQLAQQNPLKLISQIYGGASA
jgi:hypothetical protein